MKKTLSKEVVSKLNILLSKRDKKLLILLVVFSVVTSLIEAIGIAAIMPFISVASDFNVIHSKEYLSVVYEFFSFESESKFVITFGYVLIFYYIFRGFVNLLYYHVLSRFSNNRYHQISRRLFENYMELPYGNFVGRNSSAMTKAIVTEAFNYSAIIFSLLFLLSEIFIVIFIYATIFYIDYKITLSLTLILIINSVLMLNTISPRIKEAGFKRESAVKDLYEVINRSLGNFKLSKIYSNNREIINSFSRVNYAHAKVNVIAQTLNQVPRLFLESVAFSIIVAIVIYFIVVYKGNISELLALVSIFVLALYRLMPSVSRIMNNYNTILFNYKALDVIYSDLMHDGENLGNSEIAFKNRITIKNLSFGYEKKHQILNEINLEIKKGMSIAFVGPSGSGKSTLVDLIMGLYKIESGEILIDGNLIDESNIRSWRRKIGYIPQSIYLFDGTVGENISFGSEYDQDKIDKVLKIANLYDFLNQKNGQNTRVGEGGIMLSGGQQQRIAIARALYNDPEVLVLDEATSSLDEDVERKIMKEIYDISKNKTLLIIAHRVNTLYRCDKTYNVENGNCILKGNINS